MKHSSHHFILFAAIFLCLFCCQKEQQEAPPIVAATFPCDTTLAQAVKNWPNTLDTTPDLAAAHLAEIIRKGGDCHDRESDLLVAEAWHQLGNKYYSNSEYSTALLYFQKGLALRKPHLDKHHRDMLRSYHMIGSAYSGEKDYHTALTYYDSAGVWTNEASTVPHIRNLVMKGFAYLELNELLRSKMYLRMAYDSIKSKDHAADRWLSESLIQYSSCCRTLHQYGEAIQAGKESLKWVSASENPPLFEASACLVIGNAYQDSANSCKDLSIKSGLFQQAIFYTEKAKSLYQHLGYQKGMLAVGNLSEVYRRADKPDEAQQVLNQILDTFSRKKAPELAQFYMIRGKTWVDKQQYQNALSDFDSALSCLAPVYQSNSPLPSLASPIYNRFDLLELLSDMASVQIEHYKTNGSLTYLDKAAVTFDTLLTLLNQIRGDFLSDEAKIKLAGDSRNILDKAFGGYLQLYHRTDEPKYLERAFEIAEQRKAFALLEVARLNNADATLPNDLRQRKRTLTQEQSGIEQKKVVFWNNPDSMKILNEAQLRNLEQSRALQLEIKSRYPNYDKLRQKGTDLNVVAIQKEMLGEDQGLVEYFCRDSVLEIFLITKTEFKIYSSPIDRTDFANAVNEFIQLSARPDIGGEHSESREKQMCDKAHELYLILLDSLKKDLPARLIIIPDAPFLTLPFEALAMNPATGDIHQQITDRNFMLFDHSISYCFSANLLWEMQQSETPAGLKSELAAFAPRFPEHLVAGSNLPPFFVQTVQDLKPLGNQREVKEIAEKVPVRSYEDTAATKESFWEACKNYAFVHVASHGILNQDPNLNFVAFSQNRDTLDQSELLFLRELYAQRLHQELIVFSACETSLGQYREGEGNLSMARGLAYSGVRSFITTLWKVSPDANRQIMPGFYQQFLGEKKPKDVALAEARRSFILASADNEQLDKWAGLVLIGSTERARKSDWGRWAFAAAITGGLLLFWGHRRRRKSSK